MKFNPVQAIQSLFSPLDKLSAVSEAEFILTQDIHKVLTVDLKGAANDMASELSTQTSILKDIKSLIKDQIIPYLHQKFSLNYITTRIVSVVGIPESILADMIENWELALPENLALSYLPVGTRVKLRLTATGENEPFLKQQLDEEIQKLLPLIKDNVIATSEDKIEKILAEILNERKLTLSTAESCTGGELAKMITSVSGSSAYFLGGIVSYATEKKIDILKVKKETVEEFTVVSEQVADEMAKGCQKLFNTDITLSTTGVAGPGKGEDGQEVGTVFYTIRVGDKAVTLKLYMPHLERLDFMHFVSQKIIQDLVGILISDKTKLLKPKSGC